MARSKYTIIQENELKEEYLAAETTAQREAVIREYVEKWDKSEHSIRAKLSKMKIYKPKNPVSKLTGEKAQTKEQLVRRIAELCGVTTNIFDGLEKGPKLALIAIIRKLEENQ